MNKLYFTKMEILTQPKNSTFAQSGLIVQVI